MKGESLEKAVDACVEAIEKLDIDIQDKVELMLNISAFLKIKYYPQTIALLQAQRSKDQDPRFRR